MHSLNTPARGKNTINSSNFGQSNKENLEVNVLDCFYLSGMYRSRSGHDNIHIDH